MKAEGKAETIGKRELVVHSVARIERIVLFPGVAWNYRTAIGCDGKPDICRPGFDPAFQPAA